MALDIKQSDDGASFAVKVVPGSSRSRIAGLLGEALKVNIATPAEKGKANKELIRLLAEVLSRPKSSFSIISGAHDSRKQICVVGLTANELEKQLIEYLK